MSLTRRQKAELIFAFGVPLVGLLIYLVLLVLRR